MAQFIKEHPNNPKLLDYLDETAALKAAVEMGEPDDIQRKSITLAAELNRDQDYQQFDAERAKEQKVIEAQGLGDAIRRAQIQRAFLIDYVTKNPLASEVANLLPLIKQLNLALDKPSLDLLQRLTGQIDLAIREGNLDEAFRAAQARPAADSAAEHAAVEQIAKDVAAGARKGFGVVLLLKGKSPNLCVVAPEKTEAHEQLILKNADKLTFDMHVAPALAMRSAEDAVVAARKMQCGAVYASAPDLKTISEGLFRDSTQFNFSSLWITPAELDLKDTELAEKKRLDAQQSFERRQKADDEARLRAQRDKDVAKMQSEQQSKLRAEYDGPAKAAVANIVADVLNWEQSQRGPVGPEYPQFAAWLAATKADHWEIMTTESDVQDYGTSDFKGRSLDTAFARVTIRLRNPILGEYKDACFVFGQIADREFGMTREPIVANCEDADAITLWQADHKYHSRWVVGG